MKIDSSYKAPAPAVSTRQPLATTSGSSSTQEAVTLSQTSSTLQSSSGAPVNAAKIQEIKQAIAEGRFQINPEAIADSVIESARDLVKFKFASQ